MDLDRLREFVVLSEERSIKAAAMRLHIVPNVLSARLNVFEKSLGAALFDRDAHHFELTESGKILLRSSKEILDSYDKALSSLQSVQGAAFRSLRLQLCAQTMPAELGPFLDVYCRRHPSLFLDLYDENNCRIREGLQSGEVDIAFAVGRADDFADISGRIVVNDFPRMKVHVPNDHRLAKKKTIRFEELNGETFILYPNMADPFTRELQRSMLDQSGIAYYVYDENCSPFFHDLLVPVGKGIRLWNWNVRVAPNTTLLNIQDEGYETFLYMLYREESENNSVRSFINAFLDFRKERR